MLIILALCLSLATFARAVEPWEINRQFVTNEFPNGQPDAGPVTVYLDPSCTGGVHDLRPALNEVVQMATEGFTRLNSDDPNLGYGYQRIFKVAPDADLELKQQRAMRIFHRIRGMVLAPSPAAADIRIYCDNDASAEDPNEPNPRWVPADDRMVIIGDGSTPNSQLPFDRQLWWDQFNGIFRNIGTRGVQDEADDADSNDSNEALTTLAQTYRWRVTTQLSVPQNPNRETITMGDQAFEERATITELPGPHIVTLTMDKLEGLQSLTLFHELCHSHHILGVPSTGPGEIHGWPDVEASTAAVARDSADAFAFLGLYALLVKRNIRIEDALDDDGAPLLDEFGNLVVNLVPSDPSQPVVKVKRSQLNRVFLRNVRNLHISNLDMLDMRAVPFVS